MKKALSFDDVLLVPKRSEVSSRKDVDLSCELPVKQGENLKFSNPFVSAPMDTVTEAEMAAAIYKNGGVGILHRYMGRRDQFDMALRARDLGAEVVGVAVGIKDYKRPEELAHIKEVKIICVDVAHGDHVDVIKFVSWLSRAFPSKHIMAGNVATVSGYINLIKAGADSVRVGVGSGAGCSTRLVTGHGMPTFQSVWDIKKLLSAIPGAEPEHEHVVIADGGVKTSGDIVKCLAAGSRMVMMGSALAGTEESPGETYRVNNILYKNYRGMASHEAQKDWRDKSSTPEGASAMIPYKGSVKEVIKDLAGGVWSGCSYSNAHNLEELEMNASFIEVTSSGHKESKPHILDR